MTSKLRGSIRTRASVHGSIRPVRIAGCIVLGPRITGRVYIGQAGEQYPAYDGDYTAIPRPAAQTLPTEGKRMEQDVTVKGIPFFVTENPAKGNTIYIGGN